MKNSKKSFAILFSIFLITLFSFLSIYILEIKTFQSNTNTQLYIKIQSDFYLKFAKNLIENLDFNTKSTTCPNKITIKNTSYNIYANISYISGKKNCPYELNKDFNSTYSNGVAVVDLYITSKNSIFQINLHERFLKKL